MKDNFWPDFDPDFDPKADKFNNGTFVRGTERDGTICWLGKHGCWYYSRSEAYNVGGREAFSYFWDRIRNDELRMMLIKKVDFIIGGEVHQTTTRKQKFKY